MKKTDSGYIWLIVAGAAAAWGTKKLFDAAGGVGGAAAHFAQAVATAEGFYVPGSRPARNHNPGDLTLDLTGAGVGWDGPFVIYATDADGFAALMVQIQKALDGTSSVYTPDMTIMQFATKYTATDQAAWASTVAGYLGVTVDTPISEVS